MRAPGRNIRYREAAIRRGWLRGVRFAVALILGQGAVLVLTGLLAPLAGGREPFAGSWEELVEHGVGLVALIESNWQRWDALWYQHIATFGYGAHDGSLAFYPLYPILAHVAAIPSGNVVRGELFVSAAAAIGAAWSLWRLTRLEVLRDQIGDPGRDRERARRRLAPALVVLLTVLFPTGFFLLAPYTEGLFLLLTVTTFWLMRTGRLWAAGLVALLASITRAQGVILLLPLAYESLRASGTLEWVHDHGARHPPSPTLLAALLPAAGTLGFAAYQASLVGGGAGIGTQSPWGLSIVLPWQAVTASLGYIGSHLGGPVAIIEMLNLALLALALLVAVVGIRRLPVAYSLYAVPTLGLYFFRTSYFSPLMSVSRYVLVVFPCFIVAGVWLGTRPRLAMVVLAASAVAQILLYQYWVRWGFVA